MKMKFLAAAILTLLTVQTAFTLNAEKTAKKLLNGYKNKNVKVVKKYVSGLIANAISPEYFKDEAVKEYLDGLDDWDGKIREIRYSATPISVMATVYYDEAKDKGKIKVLYLSKVKKWVQFGNGFDEIKKSDFLKDSKKEPSLKKNGPFSKLSNSLGMLGLGKKKSKKKTSGENKSNKGYIIELANGEILKDPSIAQLKKSFASLDEDNFYIVISSKKGFMQGSYSKKGMDMQYKDEKGQFNCKKIIPATESEKMMADYLLGKPLWKKACDWEPME